MSRLQRLLDEIRDLEERVSEEVDREAKELGYKIQRGRVYFESEIVRHHKQMATSVHRYIADASWQSLVSIPIIYSMLMPLLILDFFVYTYQFFCFPLGNIPRVKRQAYFVFDRHRLSYLNPVEKVHCYYCSYANGLLAYCQEVASRTEQYWCPIKHARRPRGTHSRYYDFLPYGDAEAYGKELENLREKLKKSE
jgi:hypothetical protein